MGRIHITGNKYFVFCKEFFMRLHILFSFIVFNILSSPLYAGAGGTSGKGGEGSGLLLLLILPIVVGYSVYHYLMKRKSKSDAWKVLSASQNDDSAWSHKNLVAYSDDAFYNLQKMWSQNDLEGSKKYLHPAYVREYTKQLKKNINKNEFNRISNIKLKDVEIVQAQNFIDDSKDMFVAHM